MAHIFCQTNALCCKPNTGAEPRASQGRERDSDLFLRSGVGSNAIVGHFISVGTSPASVATLPQLAEVVRP